MAFIINLDVTHRTLKDLIKCPYTIFVVSKKGALFINTFGSCLAFKIIIATFLGHPVVMTVSLSVSYLAAEGFLLKCAKSKTIEPAVI